MRKSTRPKDLSILTWLSKGFLFSYPGGRISWIRVAAEECPGTRARAVFHWMKSGLSWTSQWTLNKREEPTERRPRSGKRRRDLIESNSISLLTSDLWDSYYGAQAAEFTTRRINPTVVSAIGRSLAISHPLFIEAAFILHYHSINKEKD